MLRVTEIYPVWENLKIIKKDDLRHPSRIIKVNI